MADNKVKFLKPETEEQDGLLFLKFADAEMPEFKETKNGDYIMAGKDNDFFDILDTLFNKSPKHGAIVSGKADYIFGKGYPNGDFIVNRLKESLNDVISKCILDIEIYGGFRLEGVWGFNRKIVEIYHCPYNKLRGGIKNCFYFKDEWGGKFDRKEGRKIPAFNPQITFGNFIYAYDEYRPGFNHYPLPSYLPGLNAIETDVELSKFNLSSIRNGLAPSKMIQFFNGEPTEDGKRVIERKFENKFAGSENAGKFIMAFHNKRDNALQIDDLSGSELDKMYTQLNLTTQQEIFTVHKVTSPALFGIKTEGQLGGTQELNVAYAIFTNNYTKPKAKKIDKEVNFLLAFSSFVGDFALLPADPIGLQIDPKDVVNSLPKAFVFRQLGVPEEMWTLENIGADNRATPTTPEAPAAQIGLPGQQEAAAPVNEHIKGLTAKQWQQVKRIANDLKKGRIGEGAATLVITESLGVDETKARILLDLPPKTIMSADETEDDIIRIFDGFGELREDYESIKSKTVSFSTDWEMKADEEVWIKQAFATYEVTRTEAKILDLIRKDVHIAPDLIAKAIGQSKDFVLSLLDGLKKRGILNQGEKADGIDNVIEWDVPTAPLIDAPPPVATATPVAKIKIMYSYDPKPGLQAIIKTTRPFCRKLISLDRYYSRADIEKISSRLGYSVFDRKGGWWGKNPECRHRWVSTIVKLKV